MCLIMKAIFSVVTSSAAIMRSPSFSRSVESRTTMKSPFPKKVRSVGANKFSVRGAPRRFTSSFSGAGIETRAQGR